MSQSMIRIHRCTSSCCVKAKVLWFSNFLRYFFLIYTILHNSIFYVPAVEDLLKEIFLNYTDIQGEGDSPSTTEFLTQISASRPSTSLKNSSSLKSISNFHNLNDKSKTEQTTQNAIGVTFASVKINHPHLRPLSQSMMTTTSSSIRTSDAPVQTSTSIVINQDDETLEECPKNITFTCVSTGRCIPSYLRCNFIKECPDNSDESNCRLVNYANVSFSR